MILSTLRSQFWCIISKSAQKSSQFVANSSTSLREADSDAVGDCKLDSVDSQTVSAAIRASPTVQTWGPWLWACSSKRPASCPAKQRKCSGVSNFATDASNFGAVWRECDSNFRIYVLLKDNIDSTATKHFSSMDALLIATTEIIANKITSATDEKRAQWPPNTPHGDNHNRHESLLIYLGRDLPWIRACSNLLHCPDQQPTFRRSPLSQ